MNDPFRSSGRAYVRYMTAVAPAVVTTVMALLPPLLALVGWVGPGPVAASGYGAIPIMGVIGSCRLGASHLRGTGARRACLAALQGFLWSVVILAAPALALDIAWLTGHAAHAGSAEERRVFAIVAIIFGALALAAALNLYTLLRSRLWADFRAFALAGADLPAAPRR